MTTATTATTSPTKAPMTVTIEIGDYKKVIPKEIAEFSQTIKNMLEDVGDSMSEQSAIPLPNILPATFEKIIEYCQYHLDHATDTPEALKEWDLKFCDLPKEQMFNLLNGSNYLNIAMLFDHACQATAHQIENKTPEEIREYFGLPDDLTAEEKEKIKKENEWLGDI
jgi:S-phase kinase-associated protein 1